MDFYIFCGFFMVKSLRVSLEWLGCFYGFIIRVFIKIFGVSGC